MAFVIVDKTGGGGGGGGGSAQEIELLTAIKGELESLNEKFGGFMTAEDIQSITR